MGFPNPRYSRNQVNLAGKILANDGHEGHEHALEVLSNWRSCHGYPINTFQMTLRDKLRVIDNKAIVAQRLKRIPSIINKLRRFDSMQLARMQDIGGLRAIVKDLPSVYRLRRSYLTSKFKHELVAEKDYIQRPKPSGYRSIHLVYRYKNGQAPQYDGLLVELQLRSRLQHSWATAVETMGTFLNHALKSSEGPEEWLDFFALVGSAFAHMERRPSVPGYEVLSEWETYDAVVEVADALNVRERLEAFAVAADAISGGAHKGTYHLITLDPIEKTVYIESFSQRRLDAANAQYLETEKRIADGELLQAVLVSAGPISNLQRAYPNYFLDTRAFIRHLDMIRRRAIRKR